MTERILIDAEVLELRLPEDRRIQVRTAEDLEAIARKVGKPIIHELVDSYDIQATSTSSKKGNRGNPIYETLINCQGSELVKKGKHILAIYDGPWVYYCEVEEGPLAKGKAKQQ